MSTTTNTPYYSNNFSLNIKQQETKIFLASRFEEFRDLKEVLLQNFKKYRAFQFTEIELIDLNDGKADFRTALERSLNTVQRSKMMVLFVGDTYNSSNKGQLSITHLEYREARKNKIKILAYYIGKYKNKENFCSETDSKELTEFKKEVFSVPNQNYTYTSHSSTLDTNEIADKITVDILDSSRILDVSIQNMLSGISQILRSVSLINSFNHRGVLIKKFKMPISLIKKIHPLEWKLIEDKISKRENDIGIYKSGNIQDGYFLELNSIGQNKIDSNELFDNDQIIKNILIHCDASISNELLLFERLTLKERYFYSIFKNFSHHIDCLIDEEKYPSSQKKILLFRLLALYYYEKNNYQLMRKYFASCINLLEKNPKNDLSGFFIGWAEKERQLGNIEKANEIYHKVIDLFNRPNSKARFNLAIYYKNNNNPEKALKLLRDKVIDNNIEKPFFEGDSFWRKLEAIITYKIENGESTNASTLQNIINDLAISLNKNRETKKSENVLLQISKIVTNNDVLKKALIRFYIKNDINKATSEITKLSKTHFNKFQLADLWLDYYQKKGLLQVAFEYIDSFLKENTTEDNIDFLYKKIGNLYYSDGNWYKAQFYYNKITSKWINSYDLFALSISKSDENKSLKIFNNYFRETPFHKNFSRFTKNISQYVLLCLKNGKHIQASMLISSFIQNRKVSNYDDGFLSFLYQQQLRLTPEDDDTFFKILLDKSINLSKDDNQKAIVYSRFAKHLLHRNKPDYSEKVENYFKNKQTSISYSDKVDIENALSLFKKSIKLKKDSKVNLDIAQCYFKLEEYETSIKILNKLRKTEEKDSAYLYLVKIYIIKKDKTELYKKLHSIKNYKVKQRGYFDIAKSEIETPNNNIQNFEESIKNYSGINRKLSFSIYLYSINHKERSKKILTEINSNLSPSNKVNIIYHNAISEYKRPVSNRILESINRRFDTLKKYKNPHKILIDQLNNQLKKFPLNAQLYEYKFNYYFTLKQFKECESVLQDIIEFNLINKKTSSLFFAISSSYYKYSNFKISKKVDIKDQTECLIKASKFIKYARIGDENNLMFKQLYSIILYKQGNIDKHNTINKTIIKGLSAIEKNIFKKYIREQKNNIIVQLHPDILSDYFTKLELYKSQEKTGAILLKSNNVKNSVSYTIYKSIEADSEFHKENSYIILNRIRTRLSAYHFEEGKRFNKMSKYDEAKNHYRKALFYQQKAYKSNFFNDSFIGSYLATIQYLEEFKMGVKVCEMYLKNYRTAHILHKYGNFLKEVGKFKLSLRMYEEAITIAESDEHKAILYHNIIRLCMDSIKANNLVVGVGNIVELAKNSYEKVVKLNPAFQYINDSLQFKNIISKKYRK